jgi:hypothetical protein
MSVLCHCTYKDMYVKESLNFNVDIMYVLSRFYLPMYIPSYARLLNEVLGYINWRNQVNTYMLGPDRAYI